MNFKMTLLNARARLFLNTYSQTLLVHFNINDRYDMNVLIMKRHCIRKKKEVAGIKLLL